MGYSLLLEQPYREMQQEQQQQVGNTPKGELMYTQFVRPAADSTALVTLVGTLTAWLPPIAALITIVWYLLRILEMATGKQLHELIKEWKNHE